jgi:hypothetical protein
MTKRDVLAVALRVLGVYCVIQALTLVPMIGFYLTGDIRVDGHAAQQFVFTASLILVLVLYVAVGGVLVGKAEAFAQRLIRLDAAAPALGAPDWERQFFVLALKIIGVVCLAMGLADLGRILTDTVIRWSHWPQSEKVQFVLAGLLPSGVEAGLLLAVGAYLLTGARHLVAFVFRETATNKGDRP